MNYPSRRRPTSLSSVSLFFVFILLLLSGGGYLSFFTHDATPRSWFVVEGGDTGTPTLPRQPLLLFPRRERRVGLGSVSASSSPSSSVAEWNQDDQRWGGRAKGSKSHKKKRWRRISNKGNEEEEEDTQTETLRPAYPLSTENMPHDSGRGRLPPKEENQPQSQEGESVYLPTREVNIRREGKESKNTGVVCVNGGVRPLVDVPSPAFLYSTFGSITPWRFDEMRAEGDRNAPCDIGADGADGGDSGPRETEQKEEEEEEEACVCPLSYTGNNCSERQCPHSIGGEGPFHILPVNHTTMFCDRCNDKLFSGINCQMCENDNACKAYGGEREEGEGGDFHCNQEMRIQGNEKQFQCSLDSPYFLQLMGEGRDVMADILLNWTTTDGAVFGKDQNGLGHMSLYRREPGNRYIDPFFRCDASQCSYSIVEEGDEEDEEAGVWLASMSKDTVWVPRGRQWKKRWWWKGKKKGVARKRRRPLPVSPAPGAARSKSEKEKMTRRRKGAREHGILNRMGRWAQQMKKKYPAPSYKSTPLFSWFRDWKSWIDSIRLSQRATKGKERVNGAIREKSTRDVSYYNSSSLHSDELGKDRKEGWGVEEEEKHNRSSTNHHHNSNRNVITSSLQPAAENSMSQEKKVSGHHNIADEEEEEDEEDEENEEDEEDEEESQRESLGGRVLHIFRVFGQLVLLLLSLGLTLLGSSIAGSILGPNRRRRWTIALSAALTVLTVVYVMALTLTIRPAHISTKIRYECQQTSCACAEDPPDDFQPICSQSPILRDAVLPSVQHSFHVVCDLTPSDGGRQSEKERKYQLLGGTSRRSSAGGNSRALEKEVSSSSAGNGFVASSHCQLTLEDLNLVFNTYCNASECVNHKKFPPPNAGNESKGGREEEENNRGSVRVPQRMTILRVLVYLVLGVGTFIFLHALFLFFQYRRQREEFRSLFYPSSSGEDALWRGYKRWRMKEKNQMVTAAVAVGEGRGGTTAVGPTIGEEDEEEREEEEEGRKGRGTGGGEVETPRGQQSSSSFHPPLSSFFLTTSATQHGSEREGAEHGREGWSLVRPPASPPSSSTTVAVHFEDPSAPPSLEAHQHPEEEEKNGMERDRQVGMPQWEAREERGKRGKGRNAGRKGGKRQQKPPMDVLAPRDHLGAANDGGIAEGEEVVVVEDEEEEGEDNNTNEHSHLLPLRRHRREVVEEAHRLSSAQMFLEGHSLSYALPTSRFREDSEGKAILHDIHFSAASGEVVAILGPSGAGKSSLLDIISARAKVGCVRGVLQVNGTPVMASASSLAPTSTTAIARNRTHTAKKKSTHIARGRSTAVEERSSVGDQNNHRHKEDEDGEKREGSKTHGRRRPASRERGGREGKHTATNHPHFPLSVNKEGVQGSPLPLPAQEEVPEVQEASLPPSTTATPTPFFSSLAPSPSPTDSAGIHPTTNTPTSSSLLMKNTTRTALLHRQYRHLIGYVSQQDTLLPALTVRQTIYYAARLKLPSVFSPRTIQHIIEEVIHTLRLDQCVDTVIGDEGGKMMRGISGGERRRVSIAVELLSNPRILLLDEPTSGLDSASAQTVMEAVADVAKHSPMRRYAPYYFNFQPIVILSIHQPSSSIYALFDQVILLSRGYSVYSGSASAAPVVFTQRVRSALLQVSSSHHVKGRQAEKWQQQQSRQQIDREKKKVEGSGRGGSEEEDGEDEESKRRNSHRSSGGGKKKVRFSIPGGGEEENRKTATNATTTSTPTPTHPPSLAAASVENGDHHHQHNRYTSTFGGGNDALCAEHKDLPQDTAVQNPAEFLLRMEMHLNDSIRPLLSPSSSSSHHHHHGDDFFVRSTTEVMGLRPTSATSSTSLSSTISATTMTTTSAATAARTAGTVLTTVQDHIEEEGEEEERWERMMVVPGEQLLSYTSSLRRFYANVYQQMEILICRSADCLLGSYGLIACHAGVVVCLSLLLCGVYHGQNLDLPGALNRAGCITFLLLVTSFMSISGLEALLVERPLFLEERENGFYASIPYFMSKLVVDMIPFRVLPSMVLGSIIYFPMGFRVDDGWSYFYFISILVLFSVDITLMTLCIGILASSFGTAALLSSVMILLNFVFGGAMVQAGTLSSVLQMVQRLSPFFLAFEALMINELDGRACTFAPTDETGKPSASFPIQCRQYLANEGLQPSRWSGDIIQLCLYSVFFVACAILLMSYWTKLVR